MIDVPVLIVGGGPVGLTASILLSQHGIRSLLAERHPGTAILPKARGINARTMEMYRQCGVEQEIRDAGLPVERTGLIVWTKTLAGEEIERRVPGPGDAAEHGGDAGAQLPLRPGRSRAGAAALRGAPRGRASSGSTPR